MVNTNAPKTWFCLIDSEERGPLSDRELRELAQSGFLKPEHMVWKEGKSTRAKAADVRGLFRSKAADNTQLPNDQAAASPFDVFISHSSIDKVTADAICAELEREKIRCWIAPRDVMPGCSYAEAIIDGINASRAMIVVFSAASNGSQQVLREVERAISKGIPVIPFRIEDIKPSKSMEFFLSAPHWLDALTPPMESHIKQLASVVRAVLNPPTNADEKQTVGKNSTNTGLSRHVATTSRRSFMALSGVALALTLVVGAFLYNFFSADAKRVGDKLLASEFQDYAEQVRIGRGSVTFLHKAAPGRYVQWLEFAEAGNDIAELFIGRCYQEGIVVRQDNASGIPWLEKSASRGNSFAMHTLGLAYEIGQGVEIEPSKALSWYTNAADVGNTVSMRNIGWIYAGSSVGRPDKETSLKWFRKAADLDDPVAMRFIGDYYRYGYGGLTESDEEAQRWYEKAIAAGDPYLIGKELGDSLAIHFAEYLKDAENEMARAKALTTLRSLRNDLKNFGLVEFNAIFNVSDLRTSTATLSDLEGNDPLRLLYDSITQDYISVFSDSAISERTRSVNTFAEATAPRVQRWFDGKQYDDVAALWDRTFRGIDLSSLDTSLDLSSVVRHLNWCSVSLMKTGQRKEAEELIEAAVNLCDKSLENRPWDWYTKDAYSGLCFNAAETWLQVGEATEAQKLLRRGWGVTLRQFGHEDWLEGIPILPLKGEVPPGVSEAKEEFFQRFGAKGKKSSWLTRFSIECDFAGAKYPFNVYILYGPRGYAELQDQFRWLKEFRGGEVPLEIRSTFLRLNEIASRERLVFQDVALLLFHDEDDEFAGLKVEELNPADVSYAVDEITKCSETFGLRKAPLFRYCRSKPESESLRSRTDQTVAEVAAVEKWLSQPTTDIAFKEDKQSDLERLLYIAAENGVVYRDLAIYALSTSKTDEQKLEDSDKKILELQVKYAKNKSGELARDLVAAHSQKGEALLGLQKFEEALDVFREAIQICQENLEENSSLEWASTESERIQKRFIFAKIRYIATGEMSTILSNEAEVIPTLLQVRATEFSKLGDVEKVEEAAKRLTDLSPKSAAAYYNAACAYSLCLGILKKTPDKGASESRIRELQRLAISSLKEALQLGYDNFELIKSDGELDAIRGLDEFKDLLPE